MIKKHGCYYWLDIWIGKKRIRQSLKTTEHGLALERARDIKNELLAKANKKDITVRAFSLKYLNWAWDTKPASADQESRRMKKILEFFDSAGVEYLSDVTPYHLEQLRAWLKVRKVKVGDKEVDRLRYSNIDHLRPGQLVAPSDMRPSGRMDARWACPLEMACLRGSEPRLCHIGG